MLIFASAAAIFLLLEGHNFTDWCAAPETTAREYIMENYGGTK